MDHGEIALVAITFMAAIINGALGYGFSSTTVPVALLFYANRILNPAIVLVEVVVNAYVVLIHLKNIKNIAKRVAPILIATIPGVIIGGSFLFAVHPGWTKFVTFTFLLPLILLQAGGIRRPIRSEKMFGIPFGVVIGFFYSVTTVSGPPLAVMLNNQGLVKADFRAALGLIRLLLASVTATTYFYLGFYSPESHALLTTIVPSVILGIPIGTYLIRRIDPETFRRICMSFDVWFVGFGLSRVLIDLRLMAHPFAYVILVSAVVIDVVLLYNYFAKKKSLSIPSGTPAVDPVPPS